MLIDTFIEQRTKAILAPGVAYDDLVAPFRSRLANAKVYVVDADAAAMAANVSLAKPTSILAALPWIKLPAESVWLEFSNEDLSRAMAALGSPNATPANTVGRLKRSGFLFTEHHDGLAFEYVHAMDVPQQGVVAELSTVRGVFRLHKDAEVHVEAAREVRSQHPVAGKVRNLIQLVTNDPQEARANDEIVARLQWDDHPDMLRGLIAIQGAGGNRTRVQADWITEVRRLFLMAALPALILLNTRNAIAIEPGPSLEKLNRKRTKMGRPPLLEHLLIKLHLSGAQARKAKADGDGGRRLRGALVIGHFKVRETGVFWWSQHMRSGRGDPVRRTTVLTR